MKCRKRVKIGMKRQSAIRECTLFCILSPVPLCEVAVAVYTLPFWSQGRYAHAGSLFPLGELLKSRGLPHRAWRAQGPWSSDGPMGVSWSEQGAVCLGPTQGARMWQGGTRSGGQWGRKEGLSLPGEGLVLSTVVPSTEFVDRKKNEDTILSS